MSIISESPHLACTLMRGFSTEDIALLEEAFNFAMCSGGEKEIDFRRQPDMCFNPRPARVALILINDAQVTNPEIITASLLSTVFEANEDFSEPDGQFPEQVWKLAKLAATYSPQSILENSDPLAHDAGRIAVALRLDRARHIHQAAENETELSWNDFLKETEDYIALAREVSTPLHSLLLTWKRRFETRIARSNTDNSTKSALGTATQKVATDLINPSQPD